MCHIPKFEDENLIVGIESSDDAAVYKIDEGRLLVQSVDIFPPVVDNPFDYGAIAAANSLSDIYAMGGTPELAMNILCIPDDMDKDVIKELLDGGHTKIKEAGAIVCGGHSINDREPKYGLSVTGFVSPDKLLRNNTAKAGDMIILTKPLGTGILNTALKAGMIEKNTEVELIKQMSSLNKYAAEIINKYKVSACTDITGFGLLGHSYEMADGSGVEFAIDTKSVPLLPQVLDMASMGINPKGLYTNRNWLKDVVSSEIDIALSLEDVLYDPQTSGGLLVTVDKNEAKSCLDELQSQIPESRIIGEVREYSDCCIRLV